MVPQPAPTALQVLGVQPHLLAKPPPPQVAGATQVPQWSVALHPSGVSPQVSPRAAQVVGTQTPVPHWLGACAPQLWVPPQLPHDSVSPQPSGIDPQFAPCVVHVVAWHPHLLAVPAPPQVFGAGQAPQSRVPPQPSLAEPHSASRSAQVFAVQPHSLG